jgi:hypothetical protein
MQVDLCRGSWTLPPLWIIYAGAGRGTLHLVDLAAAGQESPALSFARPLTGTTA